MVRGRRGETDKNDGKELKEVFDSIAGDFSETRSSPWSEVSDFIGGLEGGDLALDLGCGNGRHLELLAPKFERAVGVDFSRSMLVEAVKRVSSKPNAELVQGDLTCLPFRDSIADSAVYIAALHHLPTRERRLGSLEDLNRVLKKGGRALISVWAIEHTYFDGERDVIRRNGYDIYVPWGSGDEEYERYYHIFNRDNLVSLLEESPLEVEGVELSSGNYYARVMRG
ncbi:MAG: methyltransferase domain-containing protein [Halobacteria archaeon]|nr:methyltransferase domain-containing protein [Halobacteria archaeon]